MTHDTDNSISQVGIPSSSSDGGGFVQQTFLGASITDFNVSAGFGDSTSTISVNLVPDYAALIYEGLSFIIKDIYLKFEKSTKKA